MTITYAEKKKKKIACLGLDKSYSNLFYPIYALYPRSLQFQTPITIYWSSPMKLATAAC